jgi:integrase
VSLYRYKGSKVWTMDFMFHGQRIRESTGTRSKTLAGDIERKRRRELEEGSAGIRKRTRPVLFSVAAQDHLETKRSSWSPKMYVIERTNIGHLLPALGKLLVCDIEAHDIAKYQQKRLQEDAAPKTINLEVGTLRAIMKRNGAWARVQGDIRLLPGQEEIGRAISPEEEQFVLRECAKSRSRSLTPFVVLAIETGARKNVIRTLRWKWVDFGNACIRFGKDKTPSSTGRIIPLNRRAVETLKFWSLQFPERKPEHYVFPAERYGGSGDVFGACAYATDPTKLMGSVKEAWEAAKRRAGVKCRFHDLRHTAVSRMLDAGVPIAKVAKIVGWSAATMVRMAARYGHFALDDLRSAVETISRPGIREGSPVNPPVLENVSGGGRAN